MSFTFAGSATAGGPATSALTALPADTASDVACVGCVSAGEVSFAYAGSATPGGAATSALTALSAGTALTAATAANATTAGDAANLGGQPPSAYASSTSVAPLIDAIKVDLPEAGGNTATGAGALSGTGTGNAAFGAAALGAATTGGTNVASGVQALAALSTGSGNVAVGYQAGLNQTTGSDNIYVANTGLAAESGAIRIGTVGVQTKVFLAGVRKVALKGTSPTIKIDANGQLGTVVSSRRFKRDIQDMGAASDALLRLRPVTFHYKDDEQGTPRRFGLIAEEVADVLPELVAYGADGAGRDRGVQRPASDPAERAAEATPGPPPRKLRKSPCSRRVRQRPSRSCEASLTSRRRWRASKRSSRRRPARPGSRRERHRR